MSIKRYCIIGLFVIMLIGCKKESNSEDHNSIIYKEFIIDHSKINNDTAFYDINSDLKIDIVVTKHIDTLGGAFHYSGTIYGLQDKTLFTYMQMKPDHAILDTNDIIINSDEFEWMDTIKYAGSIPYPLGNTNWAYGVFLKYFGFQVKKNVSKNNYGWFHLEFFVIKEIGYDPISNRAIRVGQKK
jgi:hypothetical protein